MGRLSGKSAVVIGGTHGMGRATVDALLGEGARVLLTGASPANVDNARRDLGGRALALQVDLDEEPHRDGLGRTVTEAFGTVDAVFCFAAVAEFAPFHLVSAASFDRQFGVNVRGTFFALQRLVPLLRDGGSVTTVTVTPATASPAMGVYMATKAAVRAFSQVLAAELLARKIRVNCLAPGFVDTPTLGVAGLSSEERAAFAAIGDAMTPMKRHGRMDEVAAAALFLAFDATFTTGVELPVDGGLSTVDAPD